MPSPILLPVIALALWTLLMCGWLYATRIPALRKHNVVYDPRRPAEEFHAQLPAEVRWKADNYNNLLEQPTVFYAVALTLVFLGAGSGLNGPASPGHTSRCASPTVWFRPSSTA